MSCTIGILEPLLIIAVEEAENGAEVLSHTERWVIAILPAIAIILTGILTFKVSWDQKRVQEKFFEKEKRDEKIRIFRAFKELIHDILINARNGKGIRHERVKDFHIEALNLEVLFDEKGKELHDEVYSKAIELAETYENLNPRNESQKPNEGNLEELNKDLKEHIRWFLKNEERIKEELRGFLHRKG